MKKSGELWEKNRKSIVWIFLCIISLCCVLHPKTVYATAGNPIDGAEANTAADDTKNVNPEVVLSQTEPRVILDSYEIVEGEKAKGETFTLLIYIRNTNPYATAYNVLATYTAESDNVRLIDGESNQYFIPEIAAGEVVSYELVLEVLDYYEMDTMVMDFMFTYVDVQGYGYTNMSMATPRIKKSCVLEINSLSVAETAVVNAKALVNVRYSSSGDIPVDKAVMVIEGDIAENEKRTELQGPLNNGQSYIDHYVSFQHPGVQTISVSFIYEDEEGNEYTVEAGEFQVEVREPQETTAKVTQKGDGQSEGNRTIYIVLACVGVAVCVVILLAVIWIKRKEEEKQNGSGKDNGN